MLVRRSAAGGVDGAVHGKIAQPPGRTRPLERDGRAPLVEGQPKRRTYRARFWDNDTPVGDWSDMVEVTAQP